MDSKLPSNEPITFYPIKGIANYLISKDGKVFSLISNKILKVHIADTGYPAVSIKVSKTQHIQYIHRLLAQTFLDNPNNYTEINHIDGNKQNNVLNNLEWIAGVNNIRHAFMHSLCSKQAIVDYSLLEELELRLLNEENCTFSSLSRELGLTESSSLRKLIKRDMLRKQQYAEWDSLVLAVKRKCKTNKKVKVTNVITHTCIIYDSLREAGKAIGFATPTICKALKTQKLLDCYKLEYA